MRGFVFSVLMFFVSVVTGGGLYAQNKPSGQIEITPQVYDFGTIKESDGVVTCRVKYKNVSNRPFVINFISTSCGCTTLSYDKAPLMPGRETSITISYDPADRPGYFKKDIYIISNDRRATDIITVTGTVEGRPRNVLDDHPVVFTPSALRGESNSVYYGNIPVGYRHTKAVSLYNPTDKSIRLSAATSSGRCSVSVPAVLAPKAKGQLLITYDLKTAPVYGPFSLRVDLSADGTRVATIRGEGVATPDFTSLTPEQRRVIPRADISSSFRYFEKASMKEPITHDFVLTNGGGRTLVVESVTPSSSQIEFSVSTKELAPGEKCVIRARLKPSSAGRCSEELTVVTNDPTEPVLRLRMAANVK